MPLQPEELIHSRAHPWTLRGEEGLSAKRSLGNRDNAGGEKRVPGCGHGPQGQRLLRDPGRAGLNCSPILFTGAGGPAHGFSYSVTYRWHRLPQKVPDSPQWFSALVLSIVMSNKECTRQTSNGPSPEISSFLKYQEFPLTHCFPIWKLITCLLIQK